MYCTEEDSSLYQTAKGRELDSDMKYLLENIPFNYGIQPKLLIERLTIPTSQFAETRKKLYDGIFIIRTPTNWYKRVKSHSNLTKIQARELVLKRIIENFGIFSAENLAAYTKHEFKMNELRTYLRKLEFENYLVKGYLMDGEDTLFWMLKDDYQSGLKKLIRKNNKFNELQFVLNPQDPLVHYLINEIRQKFGLGSCYVIFKGAEMTGAFKASKKGNLLKINEFIGGDNEWNVLERFMYQNGLEFFKSSEEQNEIEDIHDEFNTYYKSR
jgi:ATP-dependent Lhr-like helicase